MSRIIPLSQEIINAQNEKDEKRGGMMLTLFMEVIIILFLFLIVSRVALEVRRKPRSKEEKRKVSRPSPYRMKAKDRKRF